MALAENAPDGKFLAYDRRALRADYPEAADAAGRAAPQGFEGCYDPEVGSAAPAHEFGEILLAVAHCPVVEVVGLEVVVVEHL